MRGAPRPLIISGQSSKSGVRRRSRPYRRSSKVCGGRTSLGHATDTKAPAAQTPNALAMDHSDWNETPRGRAPGLIAGNDVHGAIVRRRRRNKRSNPARQITRRMANRQHRRVTTPFCKSISGALLQALRLHRATSRGLRRPPLPSPSMPARNGVSRSRHTSGCRASAVGCALPARAWPRALAAAQSMRRWDRTIICSTSNSRR